MANVTCEASQGGKSGLKLNLKIGVVGAIAAGLVAMGVFGFGGHSTAVKADVQAGNVYIIPQHSIPPKVSGLTPAADFSCADAKPDGTNSTGGGLAINTTNFPPANFGYGLNSTLLNNSLGQAYGAGLPLVEIFNPGTTLTGYLTPFTTIANSSTALLPTYNFNNFIYICVNTTALAGQNGANGINTGTINYNNAPNGTAFAGGDGDVTFSAIVQSNMGFFDQPSCSNPDGNTTVGEWTSDRCINTTGEGTAQLEIPNAGNNVNTVIARFTCAIGPVPTGLVFPITIQQDAGSFTFNVICKGQASAGASTLTAYPPTVEIIPARGNTSHSFIWMKIKDSNGNPVFPGLDVDFKTDRCAINANAFGNYGTSGLSPVLGTLGDGSNTLSLGAAINMTGALNAAAPSTYATWEFSAVAQTPISIFGAAPTGYPNYGYSPQASRGKTVDGFSLNGITPEASYAGAVLDCNPVQATGVTPGKANISACVQSYNALDVCLTAVVTVIGPPASITVAASPTSVTCGEKSTITATVLDAIGQNVSDHTRVEFVTNLGGVIGGTGAVAGFAANVAPVSSSVADTFSGVATAFLLTSDVTSGPYEVVATSGGTTSGDFGTDINLYGVPGNPLQTYTYNQLLTPVPLNQAGSNTIPILGAYTNVPVTTTYLGGQFSTPPVSAQVTVNCALPVTAAPAAPVPPPAITAPRTGTGIVPPNTGDAGLRGSSSSTNWALFAFGGVIALTVAGFATAKAARR
jgi:hypothetical protein